MWKLTADAEACTRTGAILGGGSENEIQALADFGRRVGFIVLLGEELSDSLNREGALPHRLKYESVPLPILYAAKFSKETFTEIKSNLQKPATPTIVTDLIKLCWRTKAITYVHNLAQKNVTEAVRKLQSLKPTKARTRLKLIIETPLRYIEREHQLQEDYLKLYR
jgi:geranylgeranyl diphosphate synthase type I